MSNNQKFKDITVTIIFEGAALNRDEKIGGNIQSIKKLTIGDKVVSFISRPAIRHYLFNTLVQSFPEDWKSAMITAQGEVAQFDIIKDDIFSSAELDSFGYMYTIGGESSITRKAPVGITKAISFLIYNQDMSFYTNHNLVHRANEEGFNMTPNPFQREENNSYFKLSFTIDSKMIGEDVILVNNKPNFDEEKGILFIEIKEKTGLVKEFKNVVKEEEKEEYIIKNCEQEIGKIKVEEKSNNIFKVHLILSEEIKKRRICQILEAIRNGLVAHSSGEDNTIIPLFMIAAPVKVPSPIFHPYIDLILENNKLKVIGISDCIKNSWIINNKVYIQDSERLQVDKLSLNKDNLKDNLYEKWDDFLKDCGLKNCSCESNNDGTNMENN